MKKRIIRAVRTDAEAGAFYGEHFWGENVAAKVAKHIHLVHGGDHDCLLVERVHGGDNVAVKRRKRYSARGHATLHRRAETELACV